MWQRMAGNHVQCDNALLPTCLGECLWQRMAGNHVQSDLRDGGNLSADVAVLTQLHTSGNKGMARLTLKQTPFAARADARTSET